MVNFELIIPAGAVFIFCLFISIDSRRWLDNGYPYKNWTRTGNRERSGSLWLNVLQIFFILFAVLVFTIGMKAVST